MKQLGKLNPSLHVLPFTSYIQRAVLLRDWLQSKSTKRTHMQIQSMAKTQAITQPVRLSTLTHFPNSLLFQTRHIRWAVDLSPWCSLRQCCNQMIHGHLILSQRIRNWRLTVQCLMLIHLASQQACSFLHGVNEIWSGRGGERCFPSLLYLLLINVLAVGQIVENQNSVYLHQSP